MTGVDLGRSRVRNLKVFKLVAARPDFRPGDESVPGDQVMKPLGGMIGLSLAEPALDCSFLVSIQACL